MSKRYNEDGFLELPAGNLCFPKVVHNSPVGSGGPRAVWQGYSAHPIPYSKELGELLSEELTKVLNLDMSLWLTYECNSVITSLVKNELKRTICALHGYYSSSNPVLSKGYFTRGIKDINFAAWLKKVRTYSLIYSTRSTFVEWPSDWDDTDAWLIQDIGDVFNYKYWFFWEEKPAMDWLVYHFIPTKAIDPDDMIEFKQVVRELIAPLNVEKVEPEEILLSNSSSGTWSDLKKKKGKVWEVKQTENSFSSTALEGHITYAYKGPLEIRECITLSIAQSNSVRLIDKQVQAVVERLQDSIHIRDPDVFDEKIAKFFDENEFFYNRDLTKEGMTKPRELCIAMLDVLQEKWPDFPAWKYKTIYSDLHITDDKTGVRRHCDRGHGLGMANALTTLMQVTIFNLIKKDDIFGRLSEDFSALFLNDDGSIASNNLQNLETYSDLEAAELERFDLLPKDTKTWYGKTGVICERYKGKYNKKESYCKYIHRIPFAACNIVHAKSMVNLVHDLRWGEVEEGLLQTLVNFFGEEFAQNEWKMPACLGGWYGPVYKGVRLDLLQIKGSFDEMRGLEAGPAIIKPPQYKKRKNEQEIYRDPITSRYNVDLGDFNDYFGIKQPMNKVKAKFARMHNERSIESWLRKEEQRRRLLTLKRYPSCLSIGEFVTEVVRRNPLQDYLPPLDLIVSVNRDVASFRSDRHKIRPINKTLSALEAIKPGCTRKDILPVPWLPGMTIYEKNQSAEERASEMVFYMPGGIDNIAKHPMQFDSKQRVLRRRDWNDSYAVWEVYASLTGNWNYPLPYRISKGGEFLKSHEGTLQTLETNVFGEDFPRFFQVFGNELELFIKDPGLAQALLDDVYGPEEVKQDNPEPEVTEQREWQIGDFTDWYWMTSPDYNVPGAILDIWGVARQLCDATTQYKSASERLEFQGAKMEPFGTLPAPCEEWEKILRGMLKLIVTHIRDDIYMAEFPAPDDIWASGSDDEGGIGLFWDG